MTIKKPLRGHIRTTKSKVGGARAKRFESALDFLPWEGPPAICPVSIEFSPELISCMARSTDRILGFEIAVVAIPMPEGQCHKNSTIGYLFMLGELGGQYD